MVSLSVKRWIENQPERRFRRPFGWMFCFAGLCLGCLLNTLAAQAAQAAGQENDRAGWYFYDDADRARIREAAKTGWGQAVVDSMKEAVAERRTHELDVPTTPSGHFHKYFCPKHKCLLTFDWDKPRQHYCPQCKEYLTGEVYDYPWLRMVHSHNQVYLRNCMMLYMITGQEEYADHVRLMLLDYAGKYLDFPIHGNNMELDAAYGGRIFSQSLGESSWIVDVAPAYMEIRPLLSDADRERIETGLFRPCSETIVRVRGGGNWQVWHNAGIASCAITLGDKELLDIALVDPKHGYDHMMEVGSTKDGWWNEGSPGYHFYPLNAMVYTAEAARCQGVNLWDERLEALFTGPLKAVYPDLSFPAHNDGWYGISLTANASLYEMAALRMENPMFDELLARCYARVERDDFRALVHGETIEPDQSPMPLESTLYDDLGVVLLRDGLRTVVFKFGPHGGGHGHPDKLSLAIHDGENEIVPDLGTSGYGVPDHVNWYIKTIAHSTVVADRASQTATSGKLVAFKPAGDGGSVEAACDTAYPGVNMRRWLSLSGGVLMDHFTCESQEEHTYDYVLILTQPLDFGDGAEAIDLSDVKGYDRITNARRIELDSPRSFELEGVTLTLDSGSETYELIQGEAPGVPIRGIKTDPKDAVFKNCHPLIVRVKGRSMSVKATWDWTE